MSYIFWHFKIKRQISSYIYVYLSGIWQLNSAQKLKLTEPSGHEFIHICTVAPISSLCSVLKFHFGQSTIFSLLVSVSFPWTNYIISVLCYHNKNNNDNSNKTCSLKLLTIIILQHWQNGHNFSKRNNFLKKFGNIRITGNIKRKLTSSFRDSNYMFKVNNRNTRMRC